MKLNIYDECILILLTCKNFTQDDMKISPCSRILSDNHLSSFKYSRREAKHAKSMTNANC